MGTILYIIAIILLIGWMIGFIGFAIGGLFHTLLLCAIIVVLINLFRGKKVV